MEGHSPLSRAQQTFHGYLPDPTLLKAPHCTLPHCILPDLTLQTPHCQIPHSTMQTALHHLEDKSSHIYYVNIAMHYTMYNIYVYYTYNNTHTAVTVHLHYSWWQCLKGGSLSTTKPKPAKTKKTLKILRQAAPNIKLGDSIWTEDGCLCTKVFFQEDVYASCEKL